MNTQIPDIIVTVDKENDMVSYEASSEEGKRFMNSPEGMDMILNPEDFMVSVPKELVVEVHDSATKNSFQMPRTVLH